MILWRGRCIGKLARVNEWQKARSIGGKAQTYASPEYKAKKEALAVSLLESASPVTGPVDLVIEVSLWKQTDTDAPIKAIMDAMEDAGVIENDRQIRDVIIQRGYHPRSGDDYLQLWLVDTATEYAGRAVRELKKEDERRQRVSSFARDGD